VTIRIPTWEQWERDLQERLGLDSTPASGARWQAPGDAVDNSHPQDSSFALLLDAKLTEKISYSIGRKFWNQWQAKAAEAGKRFIMPIRMWPRGEAKPTDVVVVGLDDFVELVEMARGNV